ncbi:hypothetical protein MUP77_19520 [Candidatus Bathyarchaeota archaeon]|nr:hypothetical protein [Candidatus Bathyarchaeota archaeon]
MPFLLGASAQHRRKRILVASALVLVSAYLTSYTFASYIVSASLTEYGGEIWWSRGPSGSLFPWPREPGMLQILTKVNEVDLFIYLLIESWILVSISILTWVVAALYFSGRLSTGLESQRPLHAEK